MAVTFQKLIQSNVDLSALGLYPVQRFDRFFCTPKGAKVLFCTGVDEIHYCTVPGFGSKIFAVNPCGDFGQMVYPVGRNLKEFLCLVMACGGEAALEQAYIMTGLEFAQYLAEHTTQQDAQRAIKALEDVLGLVPCTEPYRCLREVWQDFEPSKIPFTKQYQRMEQECRKVEKPAPILPWKVYFQGGSRRCGQEHAGREIRCDLKLQGSEWSIPAVYLCGKGLCVLAVKQISAERLRLWEQLNQNDCPQQGPKERWEREAQNPFRCELDESTVQMGGKTLRCTGGWGCYWQPELDEGDFQDPKGQSAREHFDLDPASVWMFWVMRFPWATKRRPAWNGGILTLQQQAERQCGPAFRAENPGDSVSFVHPLDGKKHWLTVVEKQPEQAEESWFSDPQSEYPTHMMVMQYTVDPPLPSDSIWLWDCDEGDRPRKKRTNQEYGDLERSYGLMGPTAENAAAVAIIGGVDGPTAVCVSAGSSVERQLATSSLHFEPVDWVEWQVMMQGQPPEPIRVLLPAE